MYQNDEDDLKEVNIFSIHGIKDQEGRVAQSQFTKLISPYIPRAESTEMGSHR